MTTNKLLNESINKIYYNHDYDLYISKCNTNLYLPKDFYSILKNPELKVVEDQGEVKPAEKWYIHFPEYKNGQFCVSYLTVLSISKIAPVYYIQHEFEVENQDDNRITPVLDGYGNEAYTKNQYNFEEQISKILSNYGLEQLFYSDIDEILVGLSFPEEVKIFGKHVKVEHALFIDFLDLCKNR